MTHRFPRFRSRRIVVLMAAVACLGPEPPTVADQEAPAGGGRFECSSLTRAAVDESLALGTRFLLEHQKPEGNFTYAYDWLERSFASGDSQVRQAGAAWGLATIYQDGAAAGEGDPAVAEAVEKALAFFERHSRTRPGPPAQRYVVYPGESKGKLGTVALVALAHIDYLRAAAATLPADKLARLRKHVDEYLEFLLAARAPDGRFHGTYELEDGRPVGDPSPYFDGEALLAIVKAARYLDRDDLRPVARAAADAGYLRNVVAALGRDRDSDTTKGYYQWSSMAFFELATSGWPAVDDYGDWLIELADWMIDVHRTLSRSRNTAYAYEGIVPAYRMAELRGDRQQAKLGCTIERGLAKLTSWQVGGPTANDFIRQHPTDDPLAIGGVQNHGEEASLRIDVTQHQMHALILARRYYYTETGGD